MKTRERLPIRVSVVESDPVRFLGLRAIFSAEPELNLFSTTVAGILQDPESEEVVLMTQNRGPAFYAGMSALKAVRPDICIIVTGPGTSDEDILRAVWAGAKGYVSDEASAEELRKAIREVHAGSVWVPAQVIARFIERATASGRKVEPRNGARISEREREVLQLLVSGCSNREIANELGIIERTVKAHVAQLLRKVGVENRIALSVHAVTHSLLSQQP